MYEPSAFLTKLRHAMSNDDVNAVRSLMHARDHDSLISNEHVLHFVLLRGCVNIVRYILEICTKLTQYILTKAIPNIINVHVLWKVTGGDDENIILVMEHAAMNGNSTLMLWFLSMDTPGNAPHNEHGIWSTIITLYHRYRIQGSYRDTCYDDCTECAINEVENMREMERASL